MSRSQGRNAYRRQFVEAINRLFPPQIFAQYARHGNAEWSSQKVLWVSLLMNWMPGATLTERFRAARKLVQSVQTRWTLPTSFSGFIQAQQRWGLVLWPLVCRRLRANEEFGDAWRVNGWLVLAVDGSRYECPRTTENEEGLKCAGREKTSPQIFQTTLQHLGTGLLWDIRLGPGTDSERRHLDQMLRELPPCALLTADAGFISYDLCVWLCRNNHTFVFRVGGNITLLEKLGWEHEQDGQTVYLWPQDRRNEPPLVLRQVRFLSPGGHPVVLLTNEFDVARLSDEDVKAIYSCRWGIELYYRTVKQTWGFRQLQSRTPETALNEQRWRVIALWALQRLVAEQLHAHGDDPRRFSGAKARSLIREFLQDLQQGSRGPALCTLLRQARRDTYKRRGSKTKRNWPRKKNDQPPQPPKTRSATASEIEKLKRLGFLIRINC